MSFIYNPTNYSSGSEVTLAYLQANYPTSSKVDGELAGKVSTTGGTLTGALVNYSSAAPTNTLEVPSYAAVQSLVGSGTTNIKSSVSLATTAALNANYSNGASGVGATLTSTTNTSFPATDGFAPGLGDRILVKNQANSTQNGIYTITTQGNGSVPWVLTRTTDFNTPAQMKYGVFAPVALGTANGGTFWILQNSVTTVGASAVTFSEYSPMKALTAGTGISFSGTNTINTSLASGTGISIVGNSISTAVPQSIPETESVAFGLSALAALTTGYNDTGIGWKALGSTTTGHDNIGVGTAAGFGVTTGNQNIALGSSSGVSLTGSNNIAVGYNANVAGTADNYSLVIGSGAVGQGSNTTVIATNYVPNVASPTNYLTYNSSNGSVGYSAVPTSSSGMTLISTKTPVGFNSFSFTSIPGTYSNLLIKYVCRGTNASAGNILLQFNLDPLAHYESMVMNVTTSGVTSTNTSATNSGVCGYLPSSNLTVFPTVGSIEINGYAGTTFYKPWLGQSSTVSASNSIVEKDNDSGTYWSSNAITSITIMTSIGTFATGSTFWLYGLS